MLMELVRQPLIAILLILFSLDSVVLVSNIPVSSESTTTNGKISFHEIQVMFNWLAEELEEPDASDEQTIIGRIEQVNPVISVAHPQLVTDTEVQPSLRSVPLYSYHCTYLI